ncbi:MAG: tetratricopeptide repeat protein [Candidatus Electrothrix aestuarii]|uniref:Tetratricopeptide repeat protein n=1 Tax=Candidatus Electrothrix aestuarii TaxID=3062594 RepID=A0AAU8M238_9BACT|nr:tetratricopeptide repeat protein [Candidatus Electrothrix aestuarii]
MKPTVFISDFIFDVVQVAKRTSFLLFVPLCCLLLSVGARADDQNKQAAVALFEQANILSTQGKFQQAIEQYSGLIDKYGVSASLLYNLANTYAAAGQIGPAILNYERALHLSPGDADIQGNLAQVRKDAGLYQEEQSIFRHFVELLGADQWLMIAGCAFLCLGVSVLLATLVAEKKKRGLLQWGATCTLLVVILTLPPAFFRYQDWNVGVVLTEDAHLVISPFADATPAGDIKAGRLIQVEREHGDYVLVKTDNGKSGWLAKDCFALVADIPRK